MRYKLRTLLILLAVLPPLLWIGWGKYEAWKAEQERQKQAKIWTIFDGDTAGWTYSPLSPNPFFAPLGSELPTAPPSVAVPEEPRE